jgi:hypothetical protein
LAAVTAAPVAAPEPVAVAAASEGAAAADADCRELARPALSAADRLPLDGSEAETARADRPEDAAAAEESDEMESEAESCEARFEVKPCADSPDAAEPARESGCGGTRVALEAAEADDDDDDDDDVAEDETGSGNALAPRRP